MTSLPSPSTISPAAFQQALGLYPSLVEKVYRSKIKDPKKVGDALERDKWRFEGLPAHLARLKAGEEGSEKGKGSKPDLQGGGLTKDAVERLVQWKITHGHSRPFLPAMVRKNEPSTVQVQTALALKKISASSTPTGPPSTSTVTASLDLVCKLTGIGPATGTLILSLFDPIHVPFFQDEMFAWFFPELKGNKLKYNQKEYLQLLERVRPVLDLLGVKAVDLEKVSYVLGHMELLDGAERKALEASLQYQDDKAIKQKQTPRDPVQEEGKPAEPSGTKRGTKRALKVDKPEDDPSTRKSRRKKV